MKKILAVTVASAIGGVFYMGLAHAEEPHVQPIKDYVQSDVMEWLNEPALISAINAQNEKHSGLTEAEIINLDNEWRAEAKSDAKPMIDAMLNRAVSKWLLEKQDESAGLISEAFVMDSKGLNVAQSQETSDYWQGDEAKWQKTYQAGPEAVFVDEVEVDDSSGALQSQVSVTITDPASGSAIGAITLGINVDAL